MRYAVSHDPLTRTLAIDLESNCHLDSMPLVSRLAFHNADFETQGPELALACAILTRRHCGDVFEIENVTLAPDLAEAIRIILPQTPNVGPVRGLERALFAGTVEVIAAMAGAEPQPALDRRGSRSPVVVIDWSGDFVDPRTRNGDGHRYGRYLTNAGLVASPSEVSIALALLHAGPLCRSIRTPLAAGESLASHAAIARALGIVSIGLDLVVPVPPARPAPEPPDSLAPPDRNTVWLFWENRYSERMPAYLELCLETIRTNAGTARVLVVTPETIDRYIAPETMPPRFADLSPNHKSDYLRIRLLHDFGGMWIDIDTVVFQSLSENILGRLDEAELISPGPRFSQQIFASRPRGAFVREALAALDARLAGDGALGWNALGSELIYPIAERHRCASVPMSGWLHNWRDWRKYLEPGSFDADNRLACSLYNKFLFEPLRDVGREELLGKDWLVSRMLRHALGLEAAPVAASA